MSAPSEARRVCVVCRCAMEACRCGRNLEDDGLDFYVEIPGSPEATATDERALLARIGRAYLDWSETPECYPSEELLDALGDALPYIEGGS